MIIRKVNNLDRFLLVINTMPNPAPILIIPHSRWECKISATNINGVCQYEYITKYKHLVLAKLKELNIELKEIG